MHVSILENIRHLNVDLSRSLKVRWDSNILPNSTPLQDTKLRNLNDLEFDVSRSFKVKCDGVI